MRVKSPSLTFIIFGIGQIVLNILAQFINFYKFYFALQGFSILIASLFYLYFQESIFFTYKKKSLGKVLKIATYIAQKNHSKGSKFRKVIRDVAEYLGIRELIFSKAELEKQVIQSEETRHLNEAGKIQISNEIE